jgi:predicted TIM-barrel fold metal-dependent hydrolase
MTIGSRLSRRSLLKSAVAASGCGLAQSLRAKPATENAAAKELVDTHVYLSQWPHAYLADSEPASLAAALQRHGISQAWAASFDGLFHKDVAGVNERLAEVCASTGGDFFVPFGTINPMLPDWEDDSRRCDEKHHMRGIRLHPNYHGYRLDDACFARMLQIAAERRLIVQLVAQLDVARHTWLTPKSRQLDLTPLADVLQTVRGVRVVIAGGAKSFDEKVLQSLTPLSGVYFDLNGNVIVTSLVQDQVPTKRLVFGSGAPLRSVTSAASALKNYGPNASSVFSAR